MSAKRVGEERKKRRGEEIDIVYKIERKRERGRQKSERMGDKEIESHTN